MADRVTRPPRPDIPSIAQLKGAPRGLLLYYILHSISVKPRHGYEILQDIDARTEGAWRPGVGSVYPILKKLLDHGFIQADEKNSAENRRAYRITPKGTELIKQREEMFASYSQRWMAMRRLFFDMLDPAGFTNMFVEGSKKQFDMTKELFEARRDSLSRVDLDFALREYAINLERQLDWTQTQLKSFKPGAPKIR